MKPTVSYGTIPSPTEADLKRDAAADIGCYVNDGETRLVAMRNTWIRRAEHERERADEAERQRDELAAWKGSAMDLLGKYDAIAETFTSNSDLGRSKITIMARGISALRTERDDLANRLATIAELLPIQRIAELESCGECGLVWQEVGKLTEAIHGTTDSEGGE